VNDVAVHLQLSIYNQPDMGETCEHWPQNRHCECVCLPSYESILPNIWTYLDSPALFFQQRIGGCGCCFRE